MANISITGVDELMATLQKASAFDDETQKELLYAAGDIIVEELQNAVRASGFRTEAYASSVKYRKTIKQDKNGDPYITITAVGKNEHGTRRATVLFVLNYGRSAEYGGEQQLVCGSDVFDVVRSYGQETEEIELTCKRRDGA